jgi:hypothetical protein
MALARGCVEDLSRLPSLLQHAVILRKSQSCSSFLAWQIYVNLKTHPSVQQFETASGRITFWCRRRDSNSHKGLPRRILNPLRLPFRHFGKWSIIIAIFLKMSATFHFVEAKCFLFSQIPVVSLWLEGGAVVHCRLINMQ